MNESTTTFGIDELCALADLPRRTVRYYIQLGLMDRPEGEARGARYTARHLEQLLSIRRWSAAGLSLDRIGQLLESGRDPQVPLPPRQPGAVEVRSHLLIADGVELVLEPGRAGLTPEQTRQLLRRVIALYEEVRNEIRDDRQEL